MHPATREWLVNLDRLGQKARADRDASVSDLAHDSIEPEGRFDFVLIAKDLMPDKHLDNAFAASVELMNFARSVIHEMAMSTR